MSAAEKKLLETRKVKELTAKKKYREAQAAYEQAALKHADTREKRKQRANKLLGAWIKRHDFTEEARKALATPDAKKLSPERTKIVRNKSTRGGLKPTRIVLHITVSHNRPGLSDIDATLAWFDNAASQASSHIINDAEGHDARAVNDVDKAWTQAAYNATSLSIEQIEYADKSRSDWFTENKLQLENTATWIAHWSHLYGIPIKHSTQDGVCQHRELGVAGGGHSDVGDGYPFDWVLERAKAIRQAKYGK